MVVPMVQGGTGYRGAPMVHGGPGYSGFHEIGMLPYRCLLYFRNHSFFIRFFGDPLPNFRLRNQ